MYIPQVICLILVVSSLLLAGCGDMQTTGVTKDNKPVVTTAKSATQIELSFRIPGKEFLVDQGYVFESTLKNTSMLGEVMSSAAGMGGLFEVVVLDMAGQPVDFKKETIEAISQGAKYDLINEMQRITFSKPGEYKIYCRLNNTQFQTTSDSTGRTESSPLELETEPVEITIR